MSQPVRARMPLLRALGKQDPPFEVEIGGKPYQRVEIYKHDSWAATARYRGAAGDVVCKFNRIQPVFGIPMAWGGRWLARREGQALQQLAAVPGIPAPCGPIAIQGRPAPHAVGHAFVDGHPLRRDEQLADNFFPRLVHLLETVHQHQIAYVDLHKRENVLVGRNGQPYLIDFQVCFGLWGPWSALAPLGRIFLQRLQRMDRYHLAKHVERLRPDQLSALDLQTSRRPPWFIRLHRAVAAPLRNLRRGLLAWLGVRDRSGRASSEQFAEHALRQEAQQAA